MDEIDLVKEQLRQTQLAYQTAVQMSQFKAGFLGRTAHELRSPLSSLMALHQLILSDLCNDTEEEREFIAQAYHSAEKLMKILDEIIFISKTEYGIYPLNQETRQLAEVFTDIYHLTHLQAANRHISLKISNPEPNCYIKTDKQCLIQALVILIDTGISASKEGTIELFTNVNEYTSLIEIKLNLPCYLEICSEDTNLLNQIPTNNPQEVQAFSQKLELSPGMKLLLSQNLFTVMGVNLEIVKVSPEINQHPFTQLQCSFPLISVVNQ